MTPTATNVLVALGFVATGALFFGLGIPLARGRVAPNHWYGVRTRRTLADDRIWYPANRLAGRDLIVVGLVELALGLFLLSKADHWSIEALALIGTGALVLLTLGMMARTLLFLRRFEP